MREITKINLQFHKSFSKYPAVKNKMIKAADRIEEVINTDDFKTFIKEHKFQDAQGFADTPEVSIEVYNRLMSGVEMLQPELDHEWDITVIPYYNRWSKAIGYTYPSKKEIWVNIKFYGRGHWLVADCAANMSHEWTHKAGFKHSFKRSWKWPFTVPYAVGSWVKKQVNELEGRLTLDEVESGGLNHMGWVKRAFFKVINFIF